MLITSQTETVMSQVSISVAFPPHLLPLPNAPERLFAEIMTALGKASRWEKALELMRHHQQMPMDVIVYNVGIAAPWLLKTGRSFRSQTARI